MKYRVLMTLSACAAAGLAVLHVGRAVVRRREPGLPVRIPGERLFV